MCNAIEVWNLSLADTAKTSFTDCSAQLLSFDFNYVMQRRQFQVPFLFWPVAHSRKQIVQLGSGIGPEIGDARSLHCSLFVRHRANAIIPTISIKLRQRAWNSQEIWLKRKGFKN